MVRLSLVVLAALLATAAAVSGSARASLPGLFVVIVHESNPVRVLAADDVSRLFLRKTPRWEHGEPVTPIEQSEASPVRATFTKVIHRRSLSAVRSYWQQEMFAGRAAPPIVYRNDAEVLAAVRTLPGAIGYVQAGGDLRGVRPIEVK